MEGVFSKRTTPNKLKVSVLLGMKPTDVNDPLYRAARKAIKTGIFLLFPAVLMPASVQGICAYP